MAENRLQTFATWLREDMSLSDDIAIVIDRAAIPITRKQRPSTRWDNLAKQQSFSMPKVPSRRPLLADTIEEDTATESSSLSTRMLKHTSFCQPRGGTGNRQGGDGHEGAARPGMGVKQTSLSSIPRQTSFSSLTKTEQMKMPRLVKQCAFKSLPRGLRDDNQSIVTSTPFMNKLNLPNNRPSRPRRHCVSSGGPEPYYRPKLPVRKDDSDETTDTLSSMPRLVKHTSFTVAPMLSSLAPLIGNDEKGGNGTDRLRRMTKQNSFAMPKRPTRTFDILGVNNKTVQGSRL